MTLKSNYKENEIDQKRKEIEALRQNVESLS